MNKILQFLIAGIVGTTIGSVITYEISKNKCWLEQIQIADVQRDICREQLKDQVHCKVMMERNNWCGKNIIKGVKNGNK